jgi:hypothetical protein
MNHQAESNSFLALPIRVITVSHLLSSGATFYVAGKLHGTENLAVH